MTIESNVIAFTLKSASPHAPGDKLIKVHTLLQVCDSPSSGLLPPFSSCPLSWEGARAQDIFMNMALFPSFEGLVGSMHYPADVLAQAASGLTSCTAEGPTARGTGICLLGTVRAWH